jgi:hypothetical protein
LPVEGVRLPKTDLSIPTGEMTFEEETKTPKKDGSAGGSGGSMISLSPSPI